jgi:hypothetical protein
VNFKPAEFVVTRSYARRAVSASAGAGGGGVPLDSSFAEQKKILKRCHGLFYRCAGGAEARRFNRLLIEAGLIKGL